jgi:chloramphenicol-sensitive protein RarD
MGYYLNPLLSVLLAVLVLGERLRPAQVAATAVALAGVLVMGLSYGKVPWIALSLAVTFALYGLVKKRTPVDPLRGLLLETALVLPLAAGYLLLLGAQGGLAFVQGPPGRSVLLAAAGPITAIPLLWFSAGARRIPLARVGFLQYLAPTLQLAVGVLAFHEPFTATHAASFGLIWAGVALFLGSGFLGKRADARPARDHQ